MNGTPDLNIVMVVKYYVEVRLTKAFYPYVVKGIKDLSVFQCFKFNSSSNWTM